MLPIEIRERLESISAITIHRLQFTLKVARKKNKLKKPSNTLYYWAFNVVPHGLEPWTP